MTILLLPDCDHGPDADERPFPRVNRWGSTAVIVYRLEDGQPSSEEITALTGRPDPSAGPADFFRNKET